MQKTISLNYCARWSEERRKTWSGTTWSLEQALAKRFELREVDLAVPTFVDQAFAKARRVAGVADLDLGFLRKEQILFERGSHPRADVWFQFAEVPVPRGDERHYTYQDLTVQWLLRCLRDDPDTYRWTGFDHTTVRVMEKRAKFEREFLDMAAGIFTMGKWMADFLVDEAGLPSEKVHHVGGGINSLGFYDASLRDGRTFLFAGRDFYRKGGDLVLDAFDILHSRDKELRLLIAGPASNPAVGRSGVEFVGDIPNDSLGALFAKSDCFVMPSRFEAYGLVFPEALACGIPCVARNAFEMQHFIEGGVTGRLVGSDDPEELAEAMMDCLTNSAIRRNVVEGLPAVKEMYSWDAVADRIYRVVDTDD